MSEVVMLVLLLGRKFILVDCTLLSFSAAGEVRRFVEGR